MFRKFLFYLYHLREFRFQYFGFIKEYLFIKKNLYRSIEQNRLIQKERLTNLLTHAVNEVPYYKKIADKYDIKISKDTVIQDLTKFPILTKEVMRENWNDLHTDLEGKRYSLNTSGGTTGEPITFIQSRRYNILNFCSKSIFNELGKYCNGDKLIKLWGNEEDILYMNRGVLKPIINKYFKNIIFQNSFKMSNATIYRYIKEINREKPKVMLAYVQSAYEMAKFIERYRLRIHKLNSIITSAGVLTPEIKSFIEKVFKTKVYNRYGSREVSVIGSSCEHTTKIHLNIFQKYIEILDDNDKIVGENVKGRIIITDLINYKMPLIRYEIGDKGSLNNSQCACGRGLVRLNNVYGRVVDVFKNEKGELIDGEYFTHLFYFRDNIKQFQVIQEKINQIVINIVPLKSKKLLKSTEEDIIQKIKVVMGPTCKVSFNYITAIEPSVSGKFRYTISNII